MNSKQLTYHAWEVSRLNIHGSSFHTPTEINDIRIIVSIKKDVMYITSRKLSQVR